MITVGRLAGILFVWSIATGLVQAAATNDVSAGENEGRQLSTQLLLQFPDGNQTNTGALKIRGTNGRRAEIPIRIETIAHPDSWEGIYETLPATNGTKAVRLVITHHSTNANGYELDGANLAPADTAIPFADSDFWAVDLGLEFLHWPGQRVLKMEMRRSRYCAVLESVNPSPKPGAYARVVSWIDHETGGIIHAEARGADDRMMKEFDPKEFKKVNGQWQLQEMEIRNTITGSRTRLEFNLTNSK